MLSIQTGVPLLKAKERKDIQCMERAEKTCWMHPGSSWCGTVHRNEDYAPCLQMLKRINISRDSSPPFEYHPWNISQCCEFPGLHSGWDHQVEQCSGSSSHFHSLNQQPQNLPHLQVVSSSVCYGCLVHRYINQLIIVKISGL